tara:strand:+ start:158 stop:496 length:339 start_codon:yes stop_codon:yes gene_type:complete
MIWPPIKAWTSKVGIDGQVHFVAINYGGEMLDRWVILMSVLDSDVVVEVTWSQLLDSANWNIGWEENIYYKPSELVKNKYENRNINSIQPSTDSGLTIPITKNNIRPWFINM